MNVFKKKWKPVIPNRTVNMELECRNHYYKRSLIRKQYQKVQSVLIEELGDHLLLFDICPKQQSKTVEVHSLSAACKD